MDLDVGAVVPAQQADDVLLEFAPVHGIHGGHDPGERTLFPRPLKVPQLKVVPDQPPLDLPDVLTEADEFSLLLARRLDEGVEHGHSGAEKAREALLAEPCDAVVERLDVAVGARGLAGAGPVPGSGLDVEKVGTHLPCHGAVPEQHCDAEDGPAGVNGQAAPCLWITSERRQQGQRLDPVEDFRPAGHPRTQCPGFQENRLVEHAATPWLAQWYGRSRPRPT